MARFRRLGLQRRIMLYVTVGLAAMFGVGAFVGSAAIDEATALVFDERLATAYTTAGIIERDLARLSSDVRSALPLDSGTASESPSGQATRLLDQLGQVGRYPFFSVVGVCFAGPDGQIVVDVQKMPTEMPEPGRCTTGGGQPAVQAQVARAAWHGNSVVAFSDLLVRPTSGAPAADLIVVRLASTNQSVAFDPASYGRGRQDPGTDTGPATAGLYNLEVIDPDGKTILSIGLHGHVGSLSSHYQAIASAMRDRRAVALVDAGDPAAGLEPHVMAFVPLRDTPFALLLEQPVDVALALPNELRERLVALIVVGFVGAATVAWFTTRRVVQPTERLTAAAERMTRGDFASPIDVAAQDEIEVLARTLDAMRLRLRAALQELEETNRELERRVAERTARLGHVLRKVISAQEDERHALARELHDETAQTLGALSIALDRARDEFRTGPQPALDQIQAAKEIANRLLEETRRLIMGLRPSVLDDLGLGPAIAWFAETTLAPQGIEVTLDLRGAERLPSHLEVSLFRIAQEAINNVAKHARASSARVGLRSSNGWATLGVEDDGVGFNAQDMPDHAGSGSVGLAGMQERVALLGGRLEISSQPAAGTRIAVTVPLSDERTR